VLFVLTFAFVHTIPDSWTEFPESPFQRSEVTATAVGNKIYVFGGFDTDFDGALTKVEIFDVISNTWSNTTDLPVGLHHTSATTYNGYIYLVGGYIAGWEASGRVFRFEPVSEQYTELTPLNTSRGALTTNWANGMLYAIGGAAGGFSLDTNEAFNPNTNQWTTKAPMEVTGVQYTRDHLTSGVFSGNIYVIGGRSPANLNLNLMYNPIANNWTMKAPMPSNRSGIVGAVYDERIFVFGGEGAEVFNNTEEYIPSEDAWKCRSPMPTGRHGLGAAVIGNYIFTLEGGAEVGLYISGTNEAYTPPTRDTPGECPDANSSIYYAANILLSFLLVICL